MIILLFVPMSFICMNSLPFERYMKAILVILLRYWEKCADFTEILRRRHECDNRNNFFGLL